tara:strand:+ start:395 stop:1312 length:918 start_codon:yes stop_codon:yes gene_type:complete
MALSAESMMGMTQQQATQAIAEEQSVIDSQLIITPETLQFRKNIQESRRLGIELFNPIIEDITNRTVRAVTGQIAEKNEFRTRKGKVIKKGTQYHVHYTRENEEIFMTSHKHNAFSEIIYPINRQSFIISYYNELNQQDPIILNGNVPLPNDADYSKGVFTRCFAKKANDERALPFEILPDDMDSSPLYLYLNVDWYLTGTPESVELANRRKTELAAEVWPNIGGLLNPFQYYRKITDQTPEEITRERLTQSAFVYGVENAPDPGTSSNTVTQNQAPSGYSAGSGGPPPGAMTGGATGGGGGSSY